MKNYITFFVAFCITSIVYAQITITSTDLPQAGETYLISTDTTPTISLGTPSPSFQSWNFSALSEDYPSVPTYGLTSSTPYASVFTSSNLYTYGPAAMFGSFFGGAPVNSQGMNKGYMFWKTDVGGLSIVGFRADSGSFANINVFENPMELLIGTPTTYGSTFNNTGRWVLPMNVNPFDVDTFYVNRVTKTLTTDAWGSVTTPISTYSNVIRIHEYLIKVDSAYAQMGTTPAYSLELMRDTLNNYIFMTNGLHYPVCIVHADKNNLIKNVEYYNMTFLSSESLTSEEQVKTYPNPFSSVCTIDIPSDFLRGNIHFNLFDNTGKRVYKYQTKENKINLQNDNYKAGIYFYTIENSKGEIFKGKLLITN